MDGDVFHFIHAYNSEEQRKFKKEKMLILSFYKSNYFNSTHLTNNYCISGMFHIHLFKVKGKL